MDFNFKVQCKFDFHYFYCAIPEDTVDVKMTIWMVDSIHTYRRDWTNQMKAYSPSLHKKIMDYEEENPWR